MASSNASIEIAAGGLVWRKTNTGREILLVHRPGYDDWAFPKGGIEGDEALIECAWREVQEETGFDVVVGRRLPDIEYVKPSGGPKQVSYWAARWVSGAFKPNSEVDRIVWLKTKKAAKQLTYERDRDLLTTLAPDWYRREHRLLLVRHAEAGKRSEWTQDDRLRPLTKQGRKQAKALVARLRPFRIDRIISSPAVRCLETVEPLAAARGVKVRTDDDLWETAGKKAIRGIPSLVRKGTTVICSHRPVIETLLDLLEITGRDDVTPKGATWCLDLDHGKAVDAHLLAAGA